MNKLKSFLPVIQEGEHFVLALLFVHAFLNGLSLLFFETTANTLFLMTYDTSQLPYVYIITAFISVVFGYFYGIFEEKLKVNRLLQFLTILTLTIIVVFYLLLEMTKCSASAMGIMIFKDMVTMVVGIEFGILTSTIFDIRQGKRLFGLLVSGEILAGMVGGVCVGALLEFLTTTQLLVISAASMFLSFLLLSKVLRLFAEKFDSAVDQEEENTNTSYSALLSNTYYRLFFIVSLLAFFVFYFIDYIFYLKIEEHYTNEKDLASFFGVYYAILNGVNLISSLFLSGKLLSRFGIGLGLLSMPVLAVVGTSSLVGALFVSVSLGFMLLIVLKLLNEVIDISILTPSFRVLYQSMPANQKNKVIAFRETIIEPSAMGMAGLLLIALSFVQSVEILCIAIVAMGATWYLLGSKLIVHYVVSLKKLLENRYEIQDDLSYEEINKDVLTKKLASDNEVDVLYALEMILRFDQHYFKTIVPSMLTHKSPKVRLAVIKEIKNLHLVEFIGELASLLNDEKDRDVLSLLIDTYGYLARGEEIEIIIQFLNNPDHVIENTAISTLMKYGGLDGILIAAKIMNNLLDSEVISQKVRGVNLLKTIGISGGYHVLLDAMKSDNKELKSLAIQTIGHLKIHRLVDMVFDVLKVQSFRLIALKALINFGDEIYTKAIDRFYLTQDSEEKGLLLKLIASIKSEQSEQFIKNLLDDESYFIAIIEALSFSNFHTTDKTFITRVLDINLRHYNEEKNLMLPLQGEQFSNTAHVLWEFSQKRVTLIFQILCFYYHKHTIFKAKSKYLSSMSEQKALAVELLDNLLDSTFKNGVLSILENSGVNDAEMILESSAIETLLTQERYPAIMKISALYEIGKSQIQSYAALLKSLENSSNPYIQETLIWTNEKLSKGKIECY